MSELKLIKPIDGQKNWGNAINGNFEMLYRKINTAIIQTQGLKDRIEEIDTLKMRTNEFIYISTDASQTVVATVCSATEWSSESPTGQIFDPENADYSSYSGWFVRIENNMSLTYANITWKTGDVLIIHKDAASMGASDTDSVVIEQWSSIMGGYYVPNESYDSIDENGQITRGYTKVPTIALLDDSSTKTIDPIIYWKPDTYSNGSFTFKPYYKNKSGQETELSGLVQSAISVPFVTKGVANYGEFQVSPGTTEHNIIVSNVYKSGDSQSVIGFDLHFMDSSNNILYFSYGYSKSNDDLIITVDVNGYTDTIKYRVNIFRNA